jgi:hypothetical protein
VTEPEASDKLSGVIIWPAVPRDRRTLLLAAAVLGTACGSGEEPDPAARAVPADEASLSTAPLAVYHTGLTFVGFGADPALLHLRLENRTEADRLDLEYRGWTVAGGSWTPVLAVVDSIPVPRAAWRIVPAGALRLGVEDGGEVASLRVRLDSGGTLRVDALEEVSAWSGVTGRRESLRSADLQVPGRFESGWLLQRQRARFRNDPVPDRLMQTFAMSDSLGNGLLILRDRVIGDEAPAAAWAWVNGVRLDWSEAVLLALPGDPGVTGSWSFEIRDVGVFGEIMGGPPTLDALPAEGPGFRLFPVRASLALGEDRLALRGVAIEERGP